MSDITPHPLDNVENRSRSVDVLVAGVTGYTASSQRENHIQSYAFVLKDVMPKRIWALAGIMFPWTSFNSAWDVICVQETRFARVASKTMRVCAFWFAPHETVIDPTLLRPIELIDAGFPFLKCSLCPSTQ